ncbi:AAA family ATPase [Candidatus Magnetominusculus dajiuhuensis]|uniref:AAA family ATPase n=1 Tax=Candidatus Magnetominusculus dajiuhuensis TaxID=3137712 RepID=UPI003B42A5F3
MGSSLDKVTINGFKSIRELNDFGLRNLNVIIGGNGAGKSNFVEFFRMISAMMKSDGLKEYVAGNADSYLFGGTKLTKSITVRMVFGLNGYDFELAPTQDGFFLINNEQRHYFPYNATRNLGSGNFNPGLLTDKKNIETASWYTYNAICSWKIYHFHDTSNESGMRRYHDQGHAGALFMDASNIAPYLFRLKVSAPGVYSEIVETVRLVIPFFDDFILEPNIHEKLRLDWRQKGLNDYPMRPTHLSDGSIRFICLATSLLQPDPPSTIIIDEPELGLHPSAISILAELIQNTSKRTQLIIATQSPALIDHFSVEDVIVVNRRDGASTFERLQEKDFNVWLETYSVGELWSKNVISGGPVYE